MLSQLPVNINKVDGSMLDMEILRAGILAEIDAVNFYEQMAALADKNEIKVVIADIIKEEKTHIGEFQALLLKYDKEQVEELQKGKEEVEELIK